MKSACNRKSFVDFCFFSDPVCIRCTCSCNRRNKSTKKTNPYILQYELHRGPYTINTTLIPMNELTEIPKSPITPVSGVTPITPVTTVTIPPFAAHPPNTVNPPLSPLSPQSPCTPRTPHPARPSGMMRCEETVKRKRKPRTVKNAYIDISDVTENSGVDFVHWIAAAKQKLKVYHTYFLMPSA